MGSTALPQGWTTYILHPAPSSCKNRLTGSQSSPFVCLLSVGALISLAAPVCDSVAWKAENISFPKQVCLPLSLLIKAGEEVYPAKSTLSPNPFITGAPDRCANESGWVGGGSLALTQHTDPMPVGSVGPAYWGDGDRVMAEVHEDVDVLPMVKRIGSLCG